MALFILTILAASLYSLNHVYAEASLEDVASLLNLNKIKEHVKYLSSLNTRMTGYSGFFKAAEYIKKIFRKYGADVRLDYYNITVPIVEYSYIEVLHGGHIYNIIAYPLYPNHVNPSSYTSPAEGDGIVYIKRLDELGNTSVRGKFVLTKFNTGWEWKVYLMLGAKGVIFIEPKTTSYMEGFLKSLSIPVAFPRLLINSSSGEMLKNLLSTGNEVRIRVNVRVVWRKIAVPNIIAVIKGSDPVKRGEIIVLAAHYDSFSHVLGKAPGATDALGIAFLLEYARVLNKYRPKRTVWLVALSGHYQGLWGSREFVSRYFRKLGVFIKGFLSIDLASDSDVLGLYVFGLGYGYVSPDSLINQKYTWIMDTFFGSWLDEAKSIFNEDFHVVDMVLNSYPPWIKLTLPMDPPLLYLESEPFTSACFGGGLSFVTTNALRIVQCTILDTYERIKWENVEPQAKYLWIALYEYVNMEIPYVLNPAELYSDWGYVTLTIQLAKYNITTAWYDNVSLPNTVFFIRAYNNPPNPKWAANGFTIVAIPDENGIFTLKGLKPFSTVDVQAYTFNEEYNAIICATDTGVYGLSREISLTVANAYKIVPVFEAASIAILQPINPQSLQINIRSIEVLNFFSHTPLIHRDVLFTQPQITAKSIPTAIQDIMAFIEPNMPSEVIVRTDEVYPLIILINSSDKHPQGYGYTLKRGECIILSPINFSRDLYHIAISRAKILVEKGAVTARLFEYYGLMVKYRELVDEALKKEDMLKVYTLSIPLWAFSRATYSSAMDQINEIILSILFFMFLAIPFSMGMERLIFMSYGVKRLIYFILIYIITAFILAIFHPGVHVATNVFILAVATALTIFLLILLVLSIGETYSHMKRIREILIGKHYAEIERLGAFMSALSIGVQNMRKRRLRTFLTITSVVITMFSLTAFTSISSAVTLSIKSSDGITPYTGILVERAPWMILRPIPYEFVYEFSINYRDSFAVGVRTWIYPKSVQILYLWNVSPSVPIKALLAVSPEGGRALGIDKIIERGEWFTEDQVFVCAISEKTAELIQKYTGKAVDLGSTIEIWGVHLKIVAIYSGDILWTGTEGVTDLDGMPITPIDPRQLSEGAMGRRLTGDEVLIIPYKLAQIMFYQEPNAISLELKGQLSREDILDIAVAFSKRLMVDAYVGYKDKPDEIMGRIYRISPRIYYSIGGAQGIVVPLTIASFTILITMLGSVYERVREIKIYSAIGLAPLHVLGLFLAESLIHAAIGGILGYIAGVIGSWTLWQLGLYPAGFYPNYASLAILIITSVAMAFSLLSTVYPAVKAAKLVTPSLERKWKITTKPTGNMWSLPLPFRSTEREACGVFEFIREYLEAHSIERVGLFYIDGGFNYSVRSTAKEDVKIMSVRMRLAPFDQGIIQDFNLIARRIGKVYVFEALVVRESGPDLPWISSNSAFFREIRKQFLIWRSLKPNLKDEYVRRGVKRFEQ